MSLHTVQTEDGSKTAFSKEFNEHYHSTKDGALNETLHKHVIPAFLHTQNNEKLVILDICFGLGYNTLMTLYYRDKYDENRYVKIFSPEFDNELLDSLLTFEYPEIFQEYRIIVDELVKNGSYRDDKTEISLYRGDAREYIRTLDKESFNVVYQDAFSPSVNPLLWTKEYFSDISQLMSENAILTTYSIALQVRLAMFENGLYIYLQKNELHRDSSIASKSKLSNLQEIDMAHKISCNKDVIPLLDLTFI